MSRLPSILAASALAATLGACSATPARSSTDSVDVASDARVGEPVNQLCFASTIDNFKMPTRNSVVVEKGVNDEYLIETMGNCFDLQNAMSLSFDTFPGSGCISKGDSIFAYDSVFGPDEMSMPAMRCPIAQIYKWDGSKAADEASMDADQ